MFPKRLYAWVVLHSERDVTYHFVIIVTLCNKIIICIPILTLKIKKDHISTSARLMGTILGRFHPLITWPHEVTWLTKNDISPLPRALWLPNLARWMFIVKDHDSSSLLVLLSRNQVIIWQMKNVIFQLPRNHGYHTWQNRGF